PFRTRYMDDRATLRRFAIADAPKPSVFSRGLERACAPGHHGYQRACDLITGQASNGPFGSPVFARAGKTDPPSRLILSQTSAGKRCLAYVIGSSSSRAVPLFVPCGRSFVPARACAATPRARVVKAGRRAYLALAPVLPGHALTDPSTARHSRRA